MRAVGLALALAGCATATPSSGTHDASGSGSGSGSIDAPAAIDAAIDAPRPIDARQPVQLVLSQTTTEAITAGVGFGCNQTASPYYTKANSYFRVFHLADFGVTGPYTVSKVSFGVEQATAGTPATDQPVQVKIGTYSNAGGGTALSGTTTPVAATSTLRVPNGSSLLIDAPIAGTFQSADNLIVEIAIPDGVAAKNVFFIGANSGGESKPGYLQAADCGASTPQSMEALATANSLTPADIILTVTGTY